MTDVIVTNPAEEIRDLEARMRVFHGQIAALRSDANDGIRIENAIALHLERMQWHQSQIDLLIYRRDNIPSMIQSVQDTLRKMRKTLNVIRNRHAIAKLIKLRKEMNSLSSGLFDDVDDDDIPEVFDDCFE